MLNKSFFNRHPPTSGATTMPLQCRNPSCFTAQSNLARLKWDFRTDSSSSLLLVKLLCYRRFSSKSNTCGKRSPCTRYHDILTSQSWRFRHHVWKQLERAATTVAGGKQHIWNRDRWYEIRVFGTYMYVPVCTEYILVRNAENDTYQYVLVCHCT